MIEQQPLQKCLWAFVPGLHSSRGLPSSESILMQVLRTGSDEKPNFRALHH